jgi:hypothetical protein
MAEHRVLRESLCLRVSPVNIFVLSIAAPKGSQNLSFDNNQQVVNYASKTHENKHEGMR